MSFLKTLSFLALFLTINVVKAQSNQKIDCKILKEIKMKYVDDTDRTVYIIIKANKHIEHLETDKYYIKSDLEWVSDCEYNATMTEITLPNFPFKPGEVMNVKFERIENGFVFATGSVRGNSFPVNFEIIK
ncbi:MULTISPECIES: hypothetical protein [Chryseobacterium]|uniref:Uncharacterized protein n=1 Tax=Chryseobacterium taihuense TaxID=1141221 RepID=A0A4U8W818_9FLAO|nr:MULTISPECIES: hypothetical protein [Chryseobacterium]QQV04261.1 hypothetical protein I6I61_07965 [Chryseobacterium sp. FDAARGOS 1104]VFB02371.1 Uncharacterised protein [Chryseobacterium taihuense]